MALPDFNADGDLPPGVHRATMDEVVARFGGPGLARRRCSRNLRHIYDLANATGQLERLVVFGSYVSNRAVPDDVDVILVMLSTFDPTKTPGPSRRLFDHTVAQARYGASVFWITPATTLGESVDVFISHWQKKRDVTIRGIVEIAP